MSDDPLEIPAQYEVSRSAPSGRIVALVITRDLGIVREQMALLARLKAQAAHTPWRRGLTIGNGWSALLDAVVPDEAQDELLAGALRLRLGDLRALRRGEIDGTDVHPMALVMLGEIAGLSAPEAAALLVADCLASADTATGTRFDPAVPAVPDTAGVAWPRTKEGASVWRLTVRALQALLNRRVEEDRFGAWRDHTES